MPWVFVTGGAGYIGSHTVLELMISGYDVVVVDSLINSMEESLIRVRKIIEERLDPRLKIENTQKLKFIKLDLAAGSAGSELDQLFFEYKFVAVIHFAGLKAVGESVEKPLYYHRINLSSAIAVLEAMTRGSCRNFIFSSSATVYGEPESNPVTENTRLHRPTNPYGRTKFFIEEICRDLRISDPRWQIVFLRYFNPVGAHESGLIGEDPTGIPNNLMPFLSQVAVGKLPFLRVFGSDYFTVDGTGVRDYIHVTDLSKAHVAAVKILELTPPDLYIYNLGTGNGVSVIQLIHAYEKACGHSIPYVISNKRPGDAAAIFCDPSLAEKELFWKAEKTIDQMCQDAWKFQHLNPNGYRS